MGIHTSRRNADLLAVISRIMKKWPHIKLTEAAEMAVNSPAPHYYVDYYTALRAVRGYRRSPVGDEGKIKRQMWRELSERCQAMTAADPRMSLPRALEKVLSECTAPRFYVRAGYARWLYSTGKLSGKRSCQGNNLKRAVS